MIAPRSNPIRSLGRWREVQAILLRYGFGMLLDHTEVQSWRQRLHLGAPAALPRSTPARVRAMLEELGPFYIKVGQLLASRSDFLPAEWIAELAQLRDQAAPAPYEQARQVIIEELGRPPEEIFASFDPQPIAAASIAQVYNATQHDGEAVVVKVRRPGVERQMNADIEILREIGRLAEARTAIGRQYGAVGIIEEFVRTLEEELDFRNEGRNADRLRRNMAELEGISVPRIQWELVTARVLTMERVEGVKIDDLAALDGAGIDRPALARRFIQSMFHQLLLDGFFHADPHPANVFVNLDDATITYLDLGMMGRLPADQREQLGDMVVAALRRDSEEIARLVLTIGVPLRTIHEPALRREIDRVLERYLTLSLSEISFAAFLTDILSIVFDQGIRLPHELTMAMKALVQSEETALRLDPQIQIIEIARSVSQQILWQRLSPSALQMSLLRSGRQLLRLRRRLPGALDRVLTQMESGKLRVDVDSPGLQRQVRYLTVVGDRLTAGLIVAGLAIASAIAMGVSPRQSWAFIPALGVIGFVLSLAAGLLLVSSAIWGWRGAGRRERDK
jgi:ubiquinone biosynthesis protein